MINDDKNVVVDDDDNDDDDNDDDDNNNNNNNNNNRLAVVTRGRPPTCSSSYRGEMRSHSKARSLPASLLQFAIFISFLMSSYLLGLSQLAKTTTIIITMIIIIIFRVQGK